MIKKNIYWIEFISKNNNRNEKIEPIDPGAKGNFPILKIVTYSVENNFIFLEKLLHHYVASLKLLRALVVKCT